MISTGTEPAHSPDQAPAPMRADWQHALRQVTLRRGSVLLALALGSLLLLVTVQVAAGTGLAWLDVQAHRLGLENRWTSTWVVMKVLESLGQRGPTAVEAFLVVGWITWRRGTWRPVLLLGGSLLALNFFVGVMKLFFSRDKPVYGDPDLFTGGLMFPSGHAGNALLTWALVGYVIARYAGVRRPDLWLRGTVVATTFVCLAVAASSVYFDSHWVSDLIAGWLIGGLVLQATLFVDGWVRRRHAEAATQWLSNATDRLRSRERSLEPV